MKLQLEIRAGEGGRDAQLLTQIQADIYRAYAKRNGLQMVETSGLG